ncbi:MAG: DUF421 domain-containing protein [Alphaproteobacteria bacterium]|nr:DUF421 domain-containing protein [Alphaproteobacteria bacterium]MBU0793715.1 DUF421 domain-containing protein [Alphaproteobacteria bacterium]MBU0876439.1 DUF421 domain-containing protein [Alphaproteobacteria bacterium]MBU1769458.1 DUF421 domain-containing protein [Alphaproteobacteria bacterium]
MLFDNLFGLVRVVIISVLAYALLVFVLRMAGKRALSKLNAFDLVVTVALGSTLATVLLTQDVAFAEGALAFAMLAGLQWLVSRLSVASSTFSGLVRSQPRLLLRDGAYLERAMAAERVTKAEIDAAIRSAGFGRRAQVAGVVLETDGSMSVIGGSDGPQDLLVGLSE